MIKSVFISLIYCLVIFSFVAWYWQQSAEPQRTWLFYFVFTIAFGQNVYYSYKRSKK
ncbi:MULTISPECIES: hypothetical protein [unclassified Agarivorans]|uniref:hypothetical protein n=1 Tax=unclassified Agarivorans TaxID=2636026 RepID=UPI003D7E82C9